jgi:hypothetical protein
MIEMLIVLVALIGGIIVLFWVIGKIMDKVNKD